MAGMINLGLVGFFGFGAYASALATRRGGAPIVAGLVAALALTAVAGGVMAMVTARMRGDYLAIITLGFSEVVRLVASNEIWLTNGTDGISGIPGPWRGQVAPATFNLIFLGLAALAVAGALVVLQRVRHSPYGRVLRAIRDDDQVTAVAGKHVIRFKVQAFAVSAGILGVAGALWVTTPHALIAMLGCGSVLNVPVAWDGRTPGTINLLHEEGWYDEGDRSIGLLFAALAVPAYLALERP
jgi:branched-chain amino acid transport system permease protein